MRKFVLAFMALFMFPVALSLCGQTQMDPPRLLVVPHDIYCNKHGYMLEGSTPDYAKALLNDQILSNVLNQVKELIQDRNQGFELVELSQAISNSKENEMLSLAHDGADSESIDEAIIRASEADVIVKVDFNINANGPQKSMHITIDGVDAFTGKSISIVTGETRPSTSSAASTLAREAVYNQMDGFLNKLLTNYQMWVEKGRPLSIELKATASSALNLKSTVGDGMVYEHVEDFLLDNAKNERGVNGSGSSTLYRYPGVYFPLQVKGRRDRTVKLTANTVGANLQRYLESLGIQSEFFTKGPGHLIVYIK